MSTKKERNAAAKLLGSKGGKNRKHSLTPERRSEIASDAAKARWNKSKNGNNT